MGRLSLIFLIPVLVLMTGCEKKTLSGRYILSEDPDARPYLEFDQTHVVVCTALLKIPYPYRISGNALKAGPGGFHNDQWFDLVIEADGTLDLHGKKYRKVNQAQFDPAKVEKK